MLEGRSILSCSHKEVQDDSAKMFAASAPPSSAPGANPATVAHRPERFGPP
jgi:hypothetical protein